MAENYVVKEPLTDAMIDAGAELTQKLVDLGLPLYAAFWLWDPDISDDWHLFFSAPHRELYEGRGLYPKIRPALDGMDEKAKEIVDLALRQMDDHSALVRALRAKYPTGGAVKRIRLRKTMLPGKFVPDGLLYLAN